MVGMTTRLIFDQSARIGKWVAEQVEQKSSWGDFYAMGAENNKGELVAGFLMNNHNGSNATGHWAIAKTGKYLPELIRHFFTYAFEHCKLKRLTGMTSTSLPKSLALAKHLGFEEEFVMKDGAEDGDMQLLVMRPETCRWLKRS